MRIIVLLAGLLLSALLQAQSSLNITRLSNHYFAGQDLANIWGYTAPNGTEFALVGAFTGTYIMRIESSGAVTQVAFVDGPDSDWREIKTYTQGTTTYAYVVSEGLSPSVGVQVINLSGLTNASPSVTSVNRLVPVTGQANPINKAHALQVDETIGVLYVFGTNLFGGRAIALNLNPDANNPVYETYLNHVGTNSNHGFVHDGYADNNWLFASHIYQGAFSVSQRTVAGTTVTLTETASALTSTPGLFTHNTWRTGSAILTTDEVSNSSLASYDISALASVKKLDDTKGLSSNSIVHNVYIRDNYAYASWYYDGILIFDVTRPANMVRVGYYDTYSLSGSGFNGCWGVYNYFPSGRIITSNINSSDAGHTTDGEMMVLQPTLVRGCYIEGKVTHVTTTGAVIQGALVELLNPSGTVILSTTTSTTVQGATTGTPEGEYKFGYHVPGSYTLRVSKSGYITQNIPVTLANGTLTYNAVALQPPPAPVELIHFDAQATAQRTAQLQWATASERDNLGFDIEYSTDAITWKSIGWVPGKGDSDQEVNYNFETNTLAIGTHYFRLHQRDEDGKTEYSDIRSVEIRSASWQAQVVPNPAVLGQNSQLFLNFGDRTPDATYATIQIYNAQQQLVHTQQISIEGEQIQVPVELSEQPAGAYFVQVLIGTEEWTATVLVK
jgi:choice-of-anchor B domain-containing protein